MFRSALLCGLLLAACDSDWRTDLWYQQSRSARETPMPEPEGSVALHQRPHYDEREDADTLQSPFPSDAASLARGRVLFVERCIACHGHEGHGGGPVSKKFPPAPDLAYTTVRARSDGFLYATVLLGGKAMPRIGEGLDDRDRWDLVHAIREIQSTTPVVAPAVPAPEVK
jgi:mono/diheme cytochrome c family protein